MFTFRNIIKCEYYRSNTQATDRDKAERSPCMWSTPHVIKSRWRWEIIGRGWKLLAAEHRGDAERNPCI